MKRRFAVLLACVGLLVCVHAQAGYSNLFIIGDSLSDSGNNAVVFKPLVTPTSDITNTFVPTFPYASGHYTNGPVWAQLFASALGLSADPALLGGTDFAFGGARTGPFNPGGLLDPTAFPPSLLTQTAALLGSARGPLSTSLFVVAGGGNDARDALAAIGGGANAALTISTTANQFATNIGTIVDELESAGGRSIVVWNAPNVGLTPAVRAVGPAAVSLGSTISAAMNAALSARLASETQVRIFDIFDLVTEVALDPGAFGLLNVSDACGASRSCDPSKYLFWDGIHPTSGGHSLIASAMLAAVVSEPPSYVLVLIGFIMLMSAMARFSARLPSQLGRVLKKCDARRPEN